MAVPFKQNQIMVGSFNIAGQNWMGFPEREQVVKRVYNDLSATIIGFQEFGIHCQKILEPLRPDMHFVLGERLDDIYVNTLAYNRTRFTAARSETIWLSKNKTRAATWVQFEDNNTDQPFLFINMHPDNKNEKARALEFKTILDFIEKNYIELPVIVTVDSNISVTSLNPRWQKPAMRRPYDQLLQAGFIDTWVATHPTIPRPFTYHGFQGRHYDIDEWGTYDTDWILVRGFKVLNSIIVEDNYGGVYPSDHYPILAQIAFAK